MAQTLMTLVVRALDKDDIADTISKLNEARIRDIPTLKALSYSEWNELGLPLGVRKKLQLELGVAAVAQSRRHLTQRRHRRHMQFPEYFHSPPIQPLPQRSKQPSQQLRLPLTRQR
jgi:hypothetical protein